MRTRCRFGLNRRFVATIEWLRLLPKPGFFPQMAQIFDMRRRMVAKPQIGPCTRTGPTTVYAPTTIRP